jgi:molybdopterin biosynthesis enzyme
MWVSKKFAYTPLREAHRLIAEITKGKTQQESVPVFHAYNRVLAEDIISDVDIPPFNISHFDGYAVRAEDTFKASVYSPVLLKVVSRIYPGEEFEGGVNAGEAVYISTGCALPAGANAVIPVEMAKNKGDYIEVLRGVQPYENVVPAGADVKGEKKFFQLDMFYAPKTSSF